MQKTDKPPNTLPQCSGTCMGRVTWQFGQFTSEMGRNLERNKILLPNTKAIVGQRKRQKVGFTAERIKEDSSKE